MSTRQQTIESGKLWQIYPDGDYQNILFEGNKTACNKWLRDNKQMRSYKRGLIRLAQVIWEAIH